jgi:hypothetical protein
MSITDDMKAFVLEHQPHGELVGDATEPEANGYLSRSKSPFGLP